MGTEEITRGEMRRREKKRRRKDNTTAEPYYRSTPDEKY